MNKYPFRVASIHDVHLGHHRTKASDVSRRLISQLTKEYIMSLDALFIPGDFLDRNLLFSDPTTLDVLDTMAYIIETCSRYNVTIMIVKGTPSHDGDQMEHFTKLCWHLKAPITCYYEKDMCIRYDEHLGIHVLFVPDEWASREDMYIEAVRLLNEHNLEQVDFIIGHNQFGYQFSDTLRDRISHLKEEDWCKLVKYHGFFGHVHVRSQFDKILVAGSYDRLTHGEEQPKGFLDVTYYEDGSHEIKFIENKEATFYKTLTLLKEYDVSNKDHFSWLLDRLRELEQDHGYIRLKYYDKSLPMKDLITLLKEYAPKYVFTALHIGEDTINIQETLPDEQVEDYLSLTQDNLLRLIQEQVSLHPESEGILSLADHYLKEVK